MVLDKSNILKYSDFLHVEWLAAMHFVSSQSGSPNVDTGEERQTQVEPTTEATK
jgi:hypothetical protein